MSWKLPGATAWQGPERLSTNYPVYDPPRVVADVCGRIVVMWPEGSSYVMKAALLHQGSWQIDTLSSADSSYNHLGMDSTGRVIALFSKGSAATYHELARDEVAWTGPRTSSSGGTPLAFAVAPNGDMALAAIIASGEGYVNTIRRYRRADDEWLAQEFISDERPRPSSGLLLPTLRFDSLGQLHALLRWPTNDPERMDVHYRRFAESWGWSTDEIVESVDLPLSNVSLGAADNGTAVAAWGFSPAGSSDLRLAYRVSDWSSSVVLAPAPMPMVIWSMATDPLGHSIVALDGNGTPRIVLTHPDATTQLVPLGAGQRANVATNGRGDFLLAWEASGATAIRVAWYR